LGGKNTGMEKEKRFGRIAQNGWGGGDGIFTPGVRLSKKRKIENLREEGEKTEKKKKQSRRREEQSLLPLAAWGLPKRSSHNNTFLRRREI